MCWDDADIMNGKPTGAIRVSFGLSSSISDVEAVASFLRDNFLDCGIQSEPVTAPSMQGEANSRAGVKYPFLKSIWVYPIKSCGGCQVEEWPLGPNGLLLDREWAVVGVSGEVLTLGREPRLACIRTQINLQSGTLP